MLFNSVEFLFYFLPFTLLSFFYIAAKYGKEPAIVLLVLASLFFYGWWNPVYLLLLLLSMIFNYLFGKALNKEKPSNLLLTLGICVNLGLLGYYKYAGFFVSTLNDIGLTQWNVESILLPLAISFFTFQQIAYLVDSYKGITKEYSVLHYALFVSFFPQLIAGPIVHHKEMLPQFSGKQTYRFNSNHMAVGLSIFAIGLFKKTVIADGIAVYATPVFSAAESGQVLDFFTAWGGALAYTFQLYFDFSGYSDMAIGLARMFGIVLPLNFYSPYKAANISEFWRRWHMTLSRFLRDYIYIPLGGNRHGEARRYANLFSTMFLGGLWHGAGWNFVIWGTLHGLYLAIHQVWVRLLAGLGLSPQENRFYKIMAWLTTFVVVVIGWVFFRALTTDGAFRILEGMAGFNGVSLPNAIYSRLLPFHDVFNTLGITVNSSGGSVFILTWVWIWLLLLACLILPNLQDTFNKASFSLSSLNFNNASSWWPCISVAKRLVWAPTKKWAWICATALVLGVMTLGQVSEFLYFQF